MFKIVCSGSATQVLRDVRTLITDWHIILDKKTKIETDRFAVCGTEQLPPSARKRHQTRAPTRAPPSDPSARGCP